MKRTLTFLVIAAVLALPLASFAASPKLAAGHAEVASDNTVTVPLEVTNGADLVGIDIALKYSPGVTIKEVRFENTRVDYFDLKATILDTDQRQIVIMMVPQTSMKNKPALAAGSGVIANLVFEVTDPAVTAIDLEPFVMEEPHHSNFFVHGSTSTGEWVQWREDPEIAVGRVQLSNAAGSVPTSYGLSQNYPNPFNPTTEISFDLPKASQVELSIFNVLGQQVRSLVNQSMEAGQHQLMWDGRDGSGSQVSSGVYFYRLSAGSFSETRKMMLLK